MDTTNTDTILTLGTGTNESPLRALLGRCQRILFDPSRFFRFDFPGMNLSESLAFGIGNAWASAGIAFFVQTFNSLVLSRLLERWMQRLLASESGFELWGLTANQFLFSSGALLLAPFLFLFRAFFASLLVYLFARLLIEDRPGAPEQVNFRSVFKIEATSLAGNWFAVVPVFGGFLSFVVSMILVVTGVRERFGVSTRRATAVVLAPWMFLFFAALLFVLAVMIGISQIPVEDLLREIDINDLGVRAGFIGA